MKDIKTLQEESKLDWQNPNLEVISTEKTEGDPTISDDGLGDGLFS